MKLPHITFLQAGTRRIVIQKNFTEAGFLGVLNSKDLPFQIKRIYWLTDTPLEIERGLHAHKNLKQYILCLSGSFKLELETKDGKGSQLIKAGDDGVLIMEPTWRILSNFEKGSVVLVIASEEYDQEDYIYDYNEFLSWVGKR